MIYLGETVSRDILFTILELSTLTGIRVNIRARVRVRVRVRVRLGLLSGFLLRNLCSNVSLNLLGFG